MSVRVDKVDLYRVKADFLCPFEFLFNLFIAHKRVFRAGRVTIVVYAVPKGKLNAFFLCVFGEVGEFLFIVFPQVPAVINKVPFVAVFGGIVDVVALFFGSNGVARCPPRPA